LPTYDYACAACGHRFEHFQSFSEALLKRCPQCGKDRLERLIGSGAGFLFKGSGFYQTDYKRSAAPAEGDKAAGAGKDQTGKDKPGTGKGAEKAPGGGKDVGGGKDSGSTGKATEKPADTPREKRPGGDVPQGPAPGDGQPG
jgi:putative FmdB family regulatory protein